MKKLFIISLFLVVLLSGCKGSSTVYNFKVRKDDYYISEDGNIIINYKTDSNGQLIELNIDRLLKLEDILFLNPLIDYDYVLEGFIGDIFIEPGFMCTDYNDMLVPINIEIGSTRFKYNRNECEYQEVDRNNIFKGGLYSRKYNLNETINVSKDTIVSITVYDENSIENFVDILNLPHTVEMLGVNSIIINYSRDGYSSPVINYYHDMAIIEQLILKHQKIDKAVTEILGFTLDVNLLDFDQLDDIVPLIDDFIEYYDFEITALDELNDLIGVISDEDVVPEEEPEE